MLILLTKGMTMLVETFECTETFSEPADVCAEAIEIIDAMELTGQRTLITPSESEPSRCPYREITAEESFVYRALCPTSIALNAYSSSPIPLRVLQIAAHAQSLNMFKRICVWDRESVTVKDPVLVAWTGGEYDWTNNRCFILARWGEELEAFAVLRKRAMVIVRERLISEAENLLARVRRASDSEVAQSSPISVTWLR